MNASLHIDTRGFQRMVADLSRMSGRDQAPIIKAEASKILGTCVRRTPSISAEQIRRNIEGTRAKYNTYAGGEIGSVAKKIYPRISVAPGKGNHWWVDRNAKGTRTFYIMNKNRRWSDERWQAYRREEMDRRADLRTAIAQMGRLRQARGLSKSSWTQIADSLGIRESPAAPGYVRRARSTSGRSHQLGTSRTIATPAQFVIELENDYRLLINKLQGARILSSAVTGRLRYFEQNLKRGVFSDISIRAKRYPGVFVL